MTGQIKYRDQNNEQHIVNDVIHTTITHDGVIIRYIDKNTETGDNIIVLSPDQYKSIHIRSDKAYEDIIKLK